MITRLCTAATAAVTILTLGGCGAGPFAKAEPQSSLVVRWSQADHRDLKANDSAHPGLRTHLVATTEDRDDVLSDLPASIPENDRRQVEEIDLGSQVIVIGVYGKCTETSHLTLDEKFLRFVVERDEDVNCGWAPTQVEVWSVDRTDLPTPIMLRDQRGDPA